MGEIMKHASLFSGIGGFDLAAEWMGWENVFHCEWNEFGQKILKHYWPEATSYGDITKTDFTIWNGKIDILTGGFPCQPYSAAGKRLGKEDERHLWPEMLRAVKEIAPTWVMGENVYGIVNWNGGLVFDEVQTDLENEGYEVQAYILPACAVNAPHRRDRVWFVAYSGLQRQKKRQKQPMGLEQLCEKQSFTNTNNPRTDNRMRVNGNGQTQDQRRERQSQSELRAIGGDAPDSNIRGRDERSESRDSLIGERQICSDESDNRNEIRGEFGDGCINGTTTNTQNTGQQARTNRQEQIKSWRGDEPMGSRQWDRFPTQSPVCSRDDGLPTELDGITFPKWRNESIKGYGNAIVPQVAYQLFKVISKINGTI